MPRLHDSRNCKTVSAPLQRRFNDIAVTGSTACNAFGQGFDSFT